MTTEIELDIDENENDQNGDEENAVQESSMQAIFPHVGLMLLLLFYLAMGTLMFMRIERSHEEDQIRSKVLRLRALYNQVATESYEQCSDIRDDIDTSLEQFQGAYKGLVRSRLENITNEHNTDRFPLFTEDIDENRKNKQFENGKEKFRTRWTYPASLLYALGVLTTTGYSYSNVATPTGQTFAVFFGLFGFPLMFLTAADIGKLFSEGVNYLHMKYQERVNDDFEYGKRRQSQQSSEIDKDTRLELPAWTVFGMTFSFCCIGAVMYSYWLDQWNYVDALYFAFNAVTNVTLGNVPIDDYYLAILTVCFVIIGLAVVTMSIDLAQNELRASFQKIHYFGRKIRNWQARWRHASGDDDINDVLTIFAKIRKRNPEKADILDAIETDSTNEMIKKMSVHSDVLAVPRQSVDAYIPQGAQRIKFADEPKITIAEDERSGSIESNF